MVAFARPARACGLTPPVGPNGLPTVCHGDDARSLFRAGIVVGGTSTRIDFDAETADLLQGATVATLDVFPLERLALSASLGASVRGRVEYRGEHFELLPGPLGGLGVSYRALGGSVPFVLASFTVSLARSTSRADDGTESSFTSRDWRAGLAVGHTVTSWAAPFVVVRYFGAGTDWAVAGGKGADAFRYHAGAGAALRLLENTDLLAEVAAFGERRISLGVGYSF
jgi:hypothetical protein